MRKRTGMQREYQIELAKRFLLVLLLRNERDTQDVRINGKDEK